MRRSAIDAAQFGKSALHLPVNIRRTFPRVRHPAVIHEGRQDRGKARGGTYLTYGRKIYY